MLLGAILFLLLLPWEQASIISASERAFLGNEHFCAHGMRPQATQVNEKSVRGLALMLVPYPQQTSS